MRNRRRSLVAVALLALLAACSGDSGSGGSDTTAAPEAETTTAVLDEAAAEAEIRVLFETFFDGSNPDTDAKIALVEDSGSIKDLYEETLAANAELASKTQAEVKTVTFTSDTTADVNYDILLDGVPILEDFLGSAIRIDGAWYITKDAFCDFTVLGNPDPPEECAAG